MTKTCSSCQKELPISDFHRRGTRHQNICKTCRKERSLITRTPRPVQSFNKSNLPALGLRIEKLEPRLRMIAARFSRDPHEAGDIFSHVCESILRSSKPDDSDTRILRLANLRAGDYVNAQSTYTFYVGPEDILGGESEDGEDTDAFEIFMTDEDSPEDALIRKELSENISKVIATLKPENQKIVALLAEGFKPAEVARKLGISPEAVSARKSTIVRQAAALMQF